MPQAPRDVPEVDPDTRGQEKPYKHEHGQNFFVYTVSNERCIKKYRHFVIPNVVFGHNPCSIERGVKYE